jgi:hypothetical protein
MSQRYIKILRFTNAGNVFFTNSLLTSSLGHPKFCYFKFNRKLSSKSGSISLCLSIRNIVLLITLLLLGNLILRVVIVFAILKTLSTPSTMPLAFNIRSSSLYTLYATKQIHTCASILRGVKWNNWSHFECSFGYTVSAFYYPQTAVLSINIFLS